MRRLFAVLALIALATPASASLQIASPTPNSMTGFNDFAGTLTGLGLTQLATGDVYVSAPGVLTFTAHASESGFTNTFSVGSLTYTESPDINPWNTPGILIGQINILAPTYLSSLGAMFTGGTPAAINTQGFGIFVGSSIAASYSELYFGYDDNGAGPDDNHDDLIVRVSFVGATGGPPPEGTPEPVSVLVWGGLAAAAVLLPGVSRRRTEV